MPKRLSCRDLPLALIPRSEFAVPTGHGDSPSVNPLPNLCVSSGVVWVIINHDIPQ